MSFNRRDYDSREAATWLRFRELFIAVLSLSILPYISRDIAHSLGHWVVIAPGVALSLAVLGGFFIYLDSRLSYSSDPARRLLVAALLITLVVGTGLNTWAVAAVWTKREPGQEAAVSKASDLDEIAGLPGVIRFAEVAGQKKLRSVPNLKVMAPYIRGILSQTKCAANRGSTPLGITHDFQCTLSPSGASRLPACRFIWSLSPVYAGAALATVQGRDDVVTTFRQGGYGKWGPPGARDATAPFVGVASVGCASRAETPSKPQNLRVAFVLSTASQITRYESIFRTVGFDWIEPDHLDEPYIVELFSLASLYRVTELISSGKAKFPQALTTSAHDVLFDSDAIQALRKVPLGGIRVGNRSDGQLGNSRGSCLLVAKTLGLTRGSVRTHITPSAVTPDLSIADRSLVLLSPGNEPISLPCTLVSALATRSISASNYPVGLSGGILHYRIAPGESKQDAQRAAYNIRAAGLTLYLLGFDVRYDKAAARVIGVWPRFEFAKTQ